MNQFESRDCSERERAVNSAWCFSEILALWVTKTHGVPRAKRGHGLEKKTDRHQPVQSPYEGGGAEGLLEVEFCDDVDVVREVPRDDVLV